ncbi:hypothetical protein ACH5RR_006752 [Cinchona calisaya]|uniref:Uncharacterized protein n=1 Tax=Cinchona calisaya TaxID=153742 RepID=A0ABD3APY8_9GENT
MQTTTADSDSPHHGFSATPWPTEVSSSDGDTVDRQLFGDEHAVHLLRSHRYPLLAVVLLKTRSRFDPIGR